MKIFSSNHKHSLLVWKRMVSRGDENISQQRVMKIHQNRWKVNREILSFDVQFVFLMMVFSSRQCHFVIIECFTEYTNLILDYGIYFYSYKRNNQYHIFFRTSASLLRHTSTIHWISHFERLFRTQIIIKSYNAIIRFLSTKYSFLIVL